MKDERKSMSGVMVALNIIFGIILVLVLVFAAGYVTMFLWNNVVVSITTAKKITLLQSYGLLILCKILFSPFYWKNNQKKRRAKHFPHDHEYWEIKGGPKNWKYYGEYWKTEGKNSFEEYIEKLHSQNRSGEE